jgi:hypothetical protein
MPHHDLTEGWTLADDGMDVVLCGPGGLEITLPNFDLTRLSHEEGLSPELIGSLRQLMWAYPLGEGEGDLHYIVTWDPKAPDAEAQHRLHVGTAVLWQLPETVGTRLQAWFAQVEEGRR